MKRPVRRKALPDHTMKRAHRSNANSLATLPIRIAVRPATPSWITAAMVLGKSPARSSRRRLSTMTRQPVTRQRLVSLEPAGGRTASRRNSWMNHFSAWKPPAARLISKRSAMNIVCTSGAAAPGLPSCPRNQPDPVIVMRQSEDSSTPRKRSYAVDERLCSDRHLAAPDAPRHCTLCDIPGTPPRPPPMYQSPIDADPLWLRGVTPHVRGRVLRLPRRRHDVECEESPNYAKSNGYVGHDLSA